MIINFKFGGLYYNDFEGDNNYKLIEAFNLVANLNGKRRKIRKLTNCKISYGVIQNPF